MMRLTPLGCTSTISSTDTDCNFFDPNLGQFHFDNPLDLRWAFCDLLKA
jgi:hypothetical protein